MPFMSLLSPGLLRYDVQSSPDKYSEGARVRGTDRGTNGYKSGPGLAVDWIQ